MIIMKNMYKEIIEKNLQQQVVNYIHEFNKNNSIYATVFRIDMNIYNDDFINISDILFNIITIRASFLFNVDTTLIITGDFNKIVLDNYPQKIIIDSNKATRDNIIRTNIKELKLDNSSPKYYKYSTSNKLTIRDCSVEEVNIDRDLNSLEIIFSIIKKLKIRNSIFNGDPLKIPTIKINAIDIGHIEIGNIKSDYLEIGSMMFKSSYSTYYIEKIICTRSVINVHKSDLRVNDSLIDSISIFVVGYVKNIKISNLDSNNIRINSVLPNSLIEYIEINELYKSDKLSFGPSKSMPEIVSALKVRKIKFTNWRTASNFQAEIFRIVGLRVLLFENILNRGELIFNAIRFHKKPNRSLAKKVKLCTYEFRKKRLSNMNKYLINTQNFRRLKKQKESIYPQNQGFAIIGSRLGKTSFENCQLPSEILLHQVDILETSFINSQNIFSIKTNNRFINSRNNIVNGYQQLRKIHDRQGDIETSSYYRALELGSRLRLLKKKKHKKLDEILEQLTLLLNKLSNNFTLSWIRVIIFLLGYAMFIFPFFLYASGYGVDVSHDGYRQAAALWGHVFDFLVPGIILPKGGKIEIWHEVFATGKTWIDMSIPVKILYTFNDFVVIPYLAYQFVAAFRRHGLK